MEKLDSQHLSLQFFLEHLLMLEHPRIHPEAFLGYPHIHAGYFTKFTDEEKDRLKTHWSGVVQAGEAVLTFHD